MDHDTLKLEWVTLERLYLNPANPRLNDPAVPHVAASIKRFGWRQPIVAKPSGEVVAGNTRLKAAKSLGMREVPVVWFQGSDLDAVAYSVADNRTHEFAAWDEPALLKLLEELKAEDALDGVGYTPEDIDSLLEELNQGLPPTAIDDPGPEEPPEEPVTKAGDLWLLGDQKLLCGDSSASLGRASFDGIGLSERRLRDTRRQMFLVARENSWRQRLTVCCGYSLRVGI